MNCPPTHRATTLVEMVLLLTIISLVLVLTLQVLRHTISIQQTCVREVTELRIREALSQRLRRDIACADRAEVDDQQQLRLTSSSGEVVLYRMSDNGWVWREVTRANEVRARDRWQLTGLARWSIRLDLSSASDGSQDVVEIDFICDTGEARPALRVLACLDSSRAYLASKPVEDTP